MEPVASPVSGSIFERRLIEKHLANNTTDPINNEPLTVEQLISLKGVCLCGYLCVCVSVHILVFFFSNQLIFEFIFRNRVASKTVRPRPPNATSIPTLLKYMQDEWVSH